MPAGGPGTLIPKIKIDCAKSCVSISQAQPAQGGFPPVAFPRLSCRTLAIRDVSYRNALAIYGTVRIETHRIETRRLVSHRDFRDAPSRNRCFKNRPQNLRVKVGIFPARPPCPQPNAILSPYPIPSGGPQEGI